MPKKIRQIFIEDNIAYIELQDGRLATIDAVNAHVAAGYNWRAQTIRNVTYVSRGVQGKVGATVYLHREIMGNPVGQIVDHIDGNGLNNLRSNLRIVTHSQNAQNQKMRKDNSTGFRGVSFIKSKNLFVASIGWNGRVKTLGKFKTAEEAANAYEKARLLLHGEYARR